METNTKESIVDAVSLLLLIGAFIALKYFNDKKDKVEETTFVGCYYSLVLTAITDLEEVLINEKGGFFINRTDIMNYRSRAEEYKLMCDAGKLKALLTEVRDETRHQHFFNKPV